MGNRHRRYHPRLAPATLSAVAVGVALREVLAPCRLDAKPASHGGIAVAAAILPGPPPPPPISDRRGKVRPGGTSESRKLTSAITGVLTAQENLRSSTPLATSQSLFPTSAATAVSLLAAFSGRWTGMTAAALPALMSLIVVVAGVAESSSSRSKGIAKFSAGQAVTLAAEQDTVLSEAGARKAFLPFGAGLTAVCAAVCVTLKVYTEKVGYFPPDEVSGASQPLQDAHNVLLLFWAVSSVAGAVVTVDQALRMFTTLSLRPPPDRSDEYETEMESLRLSTVMSEPTNNSRIVAALLVVLASLWPLITPEFAELMEKGIGEKELQEIADRNFVYIAASAGSYAAAAFLLGEKVFTDAERRIANQGRQASLAEFFSAQTAGESAVIPLRSAGAAAALAAAALAVEFSTRLAPLWTWLGYLQAVRSTLTARLARSEADAARIETTVAIRGRNEKRTQDAVSTSLLELQRIQSDFEDTVSSGGFIFKIRESLKELPLGESLDFRNLATDSRRKVHTIAAELGLVSQSVGAADERIIIVTNISGVKVEDDNTEMDGGVFNPLLEEVRNFVALGVPEQSQAMVYPTAAIALAGAAAPVYETENVTALVIPLATAGISLVTVWQERTGSAAVATATRSAAQLEQRLAEAESLLGRGMRIASAIPTCLGISISATTASILCAELRPTSFLFPFHFEYPILLVAVIAVAATGRRQKNAQRYFERAVLAVEGRSPPKRDFGSWRWWVLPAAIALLLPGTFATRIAGFCATLTCELGLIQALSASQMAAAEFYTARSARVVARATAWASEATNSSRALPIGSAGAVINALLAAGLIGFVGPLGILFPIIGIPVFIRSVQFSEEAKADSEKVARECESIASISGVIPPWSAESSSPGNIARAASEIGIFLSSNALPDPVKDNQTSGASTMKRRLPSIREGLEFVRDLPTVAVRTVIRLLQRFDEVGDDQITLQTPAERAVMNVQADLDELRVSARGKQDNRTGAIVATAAFAGVLSPFVLSEVLAEVLLPVIGAVLTVFTVNSEVDARRSVAASKVWACGLSEVAASTEELTALSGLFKSQILAVVGLSIAVASGAIIIEHKWAALGFFGPHIGTLQTGARVTLVLVQTVAAAWSVRCLRRVWEFTDRALKVNDKTADWKASPGELTPSAYFDGASQSSRVGGVGNKLLPFLAMLPSVVFAVLPGFSFKKRAILSTAAGAIVVALALLAAEQASNRAERQGAARTRAKALAMIFTNGAEQSGALLPLTSATTIAIAAVIAIAVEINPIVAACLTTFQAITWVLASRLSLTTKFEARAALSVNSNTALPSNRNVVDTGLSARFWRFLLQ